MSEQHGRKRGVKRKRAEPSQEETEGRIGRKLFHELKVVKLGAKKAKTFELQKQVKRLKSLRQKDGSADDIAAAEAQLSALKDLDSDSLGLHAFKTKLAKDRTLSGSDDLTSALTSQCPDDPFSPAPPASHLGKVQARVLSSKVLASEVSRILGEIKEALGLGPAPGAVSKASGGKTGLAAALLPARETEESDDEDGTDDDRAHFEEEPIDDGWESGTVKDSSDEGTDDEGDDSAEEPGRSGFASNSAADSSGNVGPVSAKSTAPAKKKARAEPARPGESLFLPSLSVGFTRGDSDSEWSDSEAKLADGDQRKNRRGQRARRAIWEKKYGWNAAHVKKQRELEQATGRDARGRRVRTDARGGSSFQPSHRPFPAGAGFARQPYPQPAVPRSGPPFSGRHDGPRKGAESTKPLHPSWEAKKNPKRVAIVPSAGTKIKFADCEYQIMSRTRNLTLLLLGWSEWVSPQCPSLFFIHQ